MIGGGRVLEVATLACDEYQSAASPQYVTEPANEDLNAGYSYHVEGISDAKMNTVVLQSDWACKRPNELSLYDGEAVLSFAP